ncbi:MAG: peptidoglycan DD-metalloendopeptidase family protein [Candidatus Humimicrobiaceae bacterium]|jgi:murein DD-endopeptidase MepM/ murein hydrolase activator NlpD|nr:peptidoglycan DD-metalloendopeptidase family protein [Actinomycetota bacterium]MDD5600867.1 peptidoglycan DD-metalloendopeptidase family protein [Actinomycetota bacterium]MDY0027822.1 peptidoglycan DD-metalloendopeptidase family protein [Candidatus Humimicrobiaceae bacterium]
MENKRNKSFTLLILSDAKSGIRKIRITHNLLRSLFIVGVIILTSIAILVSDLFIMRQKLNEKVVELERAKYTVNYKEVEVANLEKKTKEIETKTKILESYLKEVEDLDRMVRDITGKGGYEEEVAIYTSDLSSDIQFDEDPDEIYYYISDQEEELDDIDALLDELLEVAPELSEVLSRDKQNMEDHLYLIEHTPDMWPTWGTITTRFGGRRGGHRGLDIANRTGINVNATASGVVIFSGWHGGYGKKVMIYHGFGYTTVYAHLSSIYVNVGDEVTKGDVIGLMGNTGNSTGPHLHYEVLVDGIPTNPKDFLP